MTVTLQPRTATTTRLPLARGAAAAAALCLLGTGVVGLVGDPATLADHTRGAGAASEVTTGLAFLAGVLCLMALTPVGGWRRLLRLLAPIGLTIGGATMLAVPLVGVEPPGWLFVLAVVPVFVGMIAAGVLGTRRVWPWWTGAAVALFLPIMLVMPYNGFLMTAVWAGVALTIRRHHR